MIKQRQRVSFKDWHEVDTAGLTTNGLLFDPGSWLGGSIEDGVNLALPGMFKGTFSISFKDFEEMYELAKEARAN